MANRLRRVRGQVDAIARMVEEDSYCVDTLMQISAAIGALNKAGSIVLESHLQTCVKAAIESGGQQSEEKLAELMDVFRKYSR